MELPAAVRAADAALVAIAAHFGVPAPRLAARARGGWQGQNESHLADELTRSGGGQALRVWLAVCFRSGAQDARLTTVAGLSIETPPGDASIGCDRQLANAIRIERWVADRSAEKRFCSPLQGRHCFVCLWFRQSARHPDDCWLRPRCGQRVAEQAHDTERLPDALPRYRGR